MPADTLVAPRDVIRAVSVAVLISIAASLLLVWKVKPASATTVGDEILMNPSVSGQLQVLGKRRIASSGTRSAILYMDKLGRPWIYVRDSATGSSTHVQLPSGATWLSTSYVLRAPDDLWVLAGTGPIQLRQYRLTGDGLPTSATLLSTTTMGDGDTRPDDLIRLASGALVAAWHQQGSQGPQGNGVSYWTPSTATWSTVYPIQFMPTFASKWVVAQHPADASVWIFGNADAYGAMGAVHLTEESSHLRVDWTNATFISGADGAYNADPENPDLEAAADPSGARIVLSYQSATRKIFSTSPVVTGSYVAVARVATDGSKTFASLSTFVERISSLGLVVAPGESWIGHRPIQSDLTFNDLYVAHLANGSWDQPIYLGKLYSSYEPVVSGGGELIARMSDGNVHIFHVAAGSAPTSSPSPSPTQTVTSSPSPTPTQTSPTATCTPLKGKKCR